MGAVGCTGRVSGYAPRKTLFDVDAAIGASFRGASQHFAPSLDARTSVPAGQGADRPGRTAKVGGFRPQLPKRFPSLPGIQESLWRTTALLFILPLNHLDTRLRLIIALARRRLRFHCRFLLFPAAPSKFEEWFAFAGQAQEPQGGELFAMIAR